LNHWLKEYIPSLQDPDNKLQRQKNEAAKNKKVKDFYKSWLKKGEKKGERRDKTHRKAAARSLQMSET